MKLASLPWYDIQEVRAANDELWRRVRSRLAPFERERAPPALERAAPPRVQWRSGRVILSQACGYDVVFPERGRLTVLATPCYRTAGCRGPSYRSAIVVRRSSPYRTIADLRGARCVFNDPCSHSGMNGLRSVVAPLHRNGRFFGSVRETGSHEASLAEVRAARADVTALDCVTLGLLRRHRPRAVRGVRILGWTEPAPAPPFVTDARTDEAIVKALREALCAVLAEEASRPVRDALLLDRVEILDSAAYRSIAEVEERAISCGYPRLA